MNCNCFTDLNIIKEWGCFAMEIMGYESGPHSLLLRPTKSSGRAQGGIGGKQEGNRPAQQEAVS